jgi:nitrite reductase/ring-hydroxylating ferredoxin subunit
LTAHPARFNVAGMDGGNAKNPKWIRVIDLAALERQGCTLVRQEGRQIALFATPRGVFACNNRCPHEGYPLSEGTLDEACRLTCNWHNWKFDLASGANLDRGEGLRVYPLRITEGAVWLDVADPPAEARRAHLLASLEAAFHDNDYERIARELARLARLGDPLEALRAAIGWSWERLEYGWTHAYAGMADWLTLHAERQDDAEAQAICLLEPLDHLAENCLRREPHPFAAGERPWREDEFIGAIEAEDEAAAVASLRGAFAAGLHFADLERGFSRAALAHYADFGHSLIYVAKAGELIARLGPAVEAPLLLSLARSLVYATREELIPEFRDYAAARRDWGGSPQAPAAAAYEGLGVRRALALTAAHGAAPPLELYRALLGANARNLLRLDLRFQTRVDQPMADNAGWLDVTHGITFANAVRRQCGKFPELWPAGLLQMACFAGRNSAFVDPGPDAEPGAGPWQVADPAAFFAAAIEGLLDHGQPESIVAVHLLKTTLAVRAEATSGAAGEAAATLLAGLNRYLHSPLRRRHVRRTMRQAMVFAALGD